MEQHDLAHVLAVTLVFLFLLGIGIVLLLFPHRIQRVAAMDRWGPLTGPTLGAKFMRRYIGSRLYIWQLRLGGAFVLILAAVLLCIVVFH
jgi:hypothetical protein